MSDRRSPTREIKVSNNNRSFFSRTTSSTNTSFMSSSEEIFSDINKEIKKLAHIAEKYKKLGKQTEDGYQSRLDLDYPAQALQVYQWKIDDCKISSERLETLSSRLDGILKFAQKYQIPENEAYPFILSEIKNFQEVILPASFRDGDFPELQKVNFWGTLLRDELQPVDVLNNLKSLAAQGSVLETSECVIKQKVKSFSGASYTLGKALPDTESPVTPSSSR